MIVIEESTCHNFCFILTYHNYINNQRMSPTTRNNHKLPNGRVQFCVKLIKTTFTKCRKVINREF